MCVKNQCQTVPHLLTTSIKTGKKDLACFVIISSIKWIKAKVQNHFLLQTPTLHWQQGVKVWLASGGCNYTVMCAEKHLSPFTAIQKWPSILTKYQTFYYILVDASPVFWASSEQRQIGFCYFKRCFLCFKELVWLVTWSLRLKWFASKMFLETTANETTAIQMNDSLSHAFTDLTDWRQKSEAVFTKHFVSP